MNRKERRQRRLEMLIDEASSQVVLATKVGTAPSYISQMLGKRGVPDSFAPRLEAAMRKPEGWMDQWLPEETGAVEFEFGRHDIDLLRLYLNLPTDLREPLREMIEKTTALLSKPEPAGSKKKPVAEKRRQRPDRDAA